MLGKLVAVLILASAMLCAQDTTSQQPSPGTTPSGTTTRQQNRMQSRAAMQAKHEQMMQQMKQDLQKMKSLLEEMKTNAAGLSGKEKAAMDANAQLWQMMIDHMDHMVSQMSSMHGGMMGGGMMGGMDHSKMKGNQGNQGTTTAPPKQ